MRERRLDSVVDVDVRLVEVVALVRTGTPFARRERIKVERRLCLASLASAAPSLLGRFRVNALLKVDVRRVVVRPCAGDGAGANGRCPRPPPTAAPGTNAPAGAPPSQVCFGRILRALLLLDPGR